jgi:hypothetical protein
VVVSGEPGTGRTRLLKSSAAQVARGCSPRTFDATDYHRGRAFFDEITEVLRVDGFRVILRNIDQIGKDLAASLSVALGDRRSAGWIGATTGPEHPETSNEPQLLALFSHTVSVPALRHRIEDLKDLVPYLTGQLCHGEGPILEPAAFQLLCKFDWPGNVEQLRQVLNKIVKLQRSGVVTVDQLPPECRSVSRRTLSQIEALQRDAIVRSLAEHGGNKGQAASSLGMSRATIYRKIREYGIS